MKKVRDLIPWKVTDISLRPYKEMWSFNPSIHFDGAVWRCVLRCSDYAMPGGVTIRSRKATPGEARTKNAMVVFDPNGWRAVEIYKMRERDDFPRGSCDSVGYEDIRLFYSDDSGLQGIAASLHLRRSDRRKPVAEQVLISFDDRYDIVEAQPIRGAWSDTPQKNWVPFDRSSEPFFLYSIDRGTLFDDRGAISSTEPRVRPSTQRRSALHDPDPRLRERARERADELEEDRSEDRRRAKRGHRSRDDDDDDDDDDDEDNDDDRVVGTGRSSADLVSVVDKHEGLRGGTQLVRVGDDAWLGLAHAMKFVHDKKFYWHVFYVVDGRGKMTAASEPVKLADNGIEFAAGMAVDGDRLVVSFGVDDMECKIGETRLSAVMEKLGKIQKTDRGAPP